MLQYLDNHFCIVYLCKSWMRSSAPRGRSYILSCSDIYSFTDSVYFNFAVDLSVKYSLISDFAKSLRHR